MIRLGLRNPRKKEKKERLSAESGPSSKGANRQIAPSPGEGRSPVRRGCGAQPRDFFLIIFGRFFGKMSWS